MATGSGRAFARAALAGNPSDAYGGATLAVVVPAFVASVVVEEVAGLAGRAGRVAGGTGVDWAGRVAVAPPSRLVSATIERFVRSHGGGSTSLAARWTTTVPREVGLGGSSAIVTATLRAMCELNGPELEPAELAAFALAVETDELGIAAGPQDRVAQAYGGLTFMDFDPGYVASHDGHGRYEALDPSLLPPLYVAYREDARAHSGGIHAPLRERFDAGDPAVRAAMDELAGHARAARDALAAGDREGFAAAIDGSLDVRRRLLELDARHVAMVDAARALGASANYTGSGGAIVGSCRDGDHREAILEGLRVQGVAALALTGV